MNLLLDTEILLWLVFDSDRLPPAARELIANREHALSFSLISVWEVAIKQRLNKPNFAVDASLFYRQLRALRYPELGLTAEHTLATLTLPLVHRDPFDRILLAQAVVEGLTLVTVDKTLATYAGPILSVRQA